MSWSVSFAGQADEVVKQLEAHSATLADQSKAEYDAALPALKTLVEQNTGTVSLTANGHATFTDGERTYSQCKVTLA